MPNLITFSGNRAGTSDAEGADNCIAFLNRVKAQAEDKGGTICMEYLNSKVNHKDYMFDHFACAVDNEDAGHPAPAFGLMCKASCMRGPATAMQTRSRSVMTEGSDSMPSTRCWYFMTLESPVKWLAGRLI